MAVYQTGRWQTLNVCLLCTDLRKKEFFFYPGCCLWREDQIQEKTLCIFPVVLKINCGKMSWNILGARACLGWIYDGQGVWDLKQWQMEKQQICFTTDFGNTSSTAWQADIGSHNLLTQSCRKSDHAPESPVFLHPRGTLSIYTIPASSPGTEINNLQTAAFYLSSFPAGKKALKTIKLQVSQKISRPWPCIKRQVLHYTNPVFLWNK